MEMGDIEKVESIRFGILSETDIKKQSKKKIFTSKRYTPNDIPFPGGPIDNDIEDEYGHIELSAPIFNPYFFDSITNLLRVVCYHCSNNLFRMRESDDMDLAYKIKLPSNEEIKSCKDPVLSLWKYKNTIKSNNNKPIKCPFCKSDQPKKYSFGSYSVGKHKLANTIVGEFGKDTETILFTPEYIYALFEKITEENMKLFGYNPVYSRPSSMVLHSIPVVPLNIRKANTLPNGQKAHNHITLAYEKVIDMNDKLENMKDDKSFETWRSFLSDEIYKLFDNKTENPFTPDPSLNTFGHRINGFESKSSRISETLLSRRVQNCARSVIIPDASMDADQIGMPQHMAMKLTVPETITSSNIGRFQNFGTDTEYPMIKQIQQRGSNEIINFKKFKFGKRELVVGDIIHRNLVDDDIIILNRQPSLHKKSMMAHRIIVRKDELSIRLNPNITEPYNADFDGDEMNIHVPQSIIAATEAKCLAGVHKQTMSSALNQPSSMFIQDNVLAFYNLASSEKVHMNKFSIMNSLALSNTYSGNFKETFSNTSEYLKQILPNIIEVPENKKINKKFLREMISDIFHNHGNDACFNFFRGMQNLLNFYMKNNIFSVSPKDVSPRDSKKDSKSVQSLVQKEKRDLLENVQILSAESHSTDIDNESLEKKIMNQIETSKKKILKSIKDNEDSRFIHMINSGSKGKMSNMLQIKGIIGQQIVGKDRIGISQTRTLPHYPKYEIDIRYNGFIGNSFSSGLTPDEYFFHCSGGREGIIEQGLSTGESGFLQKQLVNFLQNFKMGFNNCIVDSSDKIIQISYGDDGFDGKNIQTFDLEFLYTMSEEDFESKYRGDSQNSTKGFEHFKKLKGKFLESFIRDHKFCYKDDENFVKPIRYHMKFPVNLKKLLKKYSETVETELTSEFIEEHYATMLENLDIDRLRKEKLEFMLLVYSSPKQILDSNLSKESFKKFVEELVYLYRCCMVDIGEPVGFLSATSIGEPTTQLTLNSFHNAGSGRVMGVPRLKELFHVQKNKESTAVTTLKLRSPFNHSERMVKDFCETQLKQIKVKDIAEKISIIYVEDDVKDDVIESYKEHVRTLYKTNKIQTKYVITIQIPNGLSLPLVKKLWKRIDDITIKSTKPQVIFLKDHDTIIFQINPLEFVNSFRLNNTLDKFEDFQLEFIINKIENYDISGVSTYSNSTYYDTVEYSIEDSTRLNKKPTYSAEISGSNLKELLILNAVNSNETFSNNVPDTCKILGIEAALKLLTEEASQVLDSIDQRHLKTLFNGMCFNGFPFGLKEFDRNDTYMNNEDEAKEDELLSDEEEDSYGNTFTNAASESLMKSVLAGCKRGTTERVSGTVDNLMTGQTTDFGTGIVRVLFDV